MCYGMGFGWREGGGIRVRGYFPMLGFPVRWQPSARGFAASAALPPPVRGALSINQLILFQERL